MAENLEVEAELNQEEEGQIVDYFAAENNKSL